MDCDVTAAVCAVVFLDCDASVIVCVVVFLDCDASAAVCVIIFLEIVWRETVFIGRAPKNTKTILEPRMGARGMVKGIV